MTVSLAKDAQRCFTNAFDAVIIIICNNDSPNTSTHNNKNIPSLPSPHNDDIIYIDGTHSPPQIASYSFEQAPPLPENASQYCTWRATRSTLKRIFDNSRTLSSTFISGRLTISGNMAIMARLNIHQDNNR